MIELCRRVIRFDLPPPPAVYVLLLLGASVAEGSERSVYVREVLADGPVGYWRFEEPEATADGIAASSAGPELAAAYLGRTVSVEGAPGVGGRAVRFDGSSGLVEIPHHESLSSNTLTVEFWFRSEQPFDRQYGPASAALVSKAEAPGNSSGYWSVHAASEVSGTDQGRLVAVTGPKDGRDHFVFSSEGVALNDGQWHHVVVTRSEDGEKRLYIDGALSVSANDGGAPIQNERPIHIGGDALQEDASYLRGVMDEVAIYARILTPQRIAIHYAASAYGSRLADPVPHSVDFVRDVRPILQRYCVECHGNDVAEGGLNLAVRARAFEGGDSVVPILRGNSAASPLIHFVSGLVEDRRMPLDGEPLDARQIGVLRAWIDQGARWPDEVAGVDRRALLAREHWAFQPIRRPAPPPVRDTGWVRNDIDAFVLARLEEAGLSPALPAKPLVLLRRAHFDLVGLPPAPESVMEYAAGSDPDRGESAFESLVERLLGSKHYGERYGRHWLDVVRYSDSAGYELDTFYNHAWKYRDYVIQSLNDDKPFDRFLHEQLAADELWPDEEDLRHATGLLAVGPYHFESGIFRPEIQEYKWLTDVADTIGSAFLGLTVGCARCHSHKFDPISQKDYYGLHAILAEATLWDTRTGRAPDNSDERRRPQNWIVVNRDTPAPVRVLHRGDLKSPGVTVAPAILRALEGGGALEDLEPSMAGRRRAWLAQWLTSNRNPLTARVLANRVWLWHFGEGLVRTPNDFGTQGERPTHPELLDYLADQLQTHDWSLKHLHRLIMSSSTYRMSSRTLNAQGEQIDPDNRLLWHFPRRRLEAEAIWDHLHATAGTINLDQFGTPVIPPIDRAILATKVGSRWNVTEDQSQWSRRGVYVIVRRSLKFPFFETFNLNEPAASCARRDTTVVSPQALTLLNDRLVLEQARACAGRLVRECGADAEGMVRRAWLLAFGRPIAADELERTLGFLDDLEQQFQAVQGDELVAPAGLPEDEALSAARGAALVELCRALFNTNEFLYVD